MIASEEPPQVAMRHHLPSTTTNKKSSFGSIRREKGVRQLVQSLSPVSGRKSPRSSSATNSPLIFGHMQRSKEDLSIFQVESEIAKDAKLSLHRGLTVEDVITSISEVAPALLVVLREDSTLAQVVDDLSSGATFVVVVDKFGNTLGVIHLLDIIHMCCQNIQKWNNPYEFVYHSKKEFSRITAKELLKTIDCYRIDEQAPLNELLQLFSTPRVEKVILMTRMKKQLHQEVRAVLTRSEMMSWLYEHRNELGDLFTQTCSQQIDKLCLIKKRSFPAEVGTQEYAEEAFLSLWKKQMCGFLLSHGTCNLEKFLNLAVQIIMAKMQDEHGVIVCIYEDDTLEKVLQCCTSRHVKRVFVVDHSRRPVAELLVSDILSTCRKALPLTWRSICAVDNASL